MAEEAARHKEWQADVARRQADALRHAAEQKAAQEAQAQQRALAQERDNAVPLSANTVSAVQRMLTRVAPRPAPTTPRLISMDNSPDMADWVKTPEREVVYANRR